MLQDRRKTLSQTGKNLLLVADYIREHGWCQRQLHDGSKSCIVGAMFRSIGGWPFYQERGRLERHTGTKILSLWNDAPGRTAEEVLQVLEDAAFDE